MAASVSEALEAGATSLLLDEDTCAANFMSRDGRMRALVNHEPITPMLYRVSGLYNELGVSSIVVIGGNGDWLDVADSVVLMDEYMAFDSTKKAASISMTFSYGHVQYAGRGVAHRLPWPDQVLRARIPDPTSFSLAADGPGQPRADSDGGGGVVRLRYGPTSGPPEVLARASALDLSRLEQLTWADDDAGLVRGCGWAMGWIAGYASGPVGGGAAADGHAAADGDAAADEQHSMASLLKAYDSTAGEEGVGMLGERAMHYDITLPRRVDVAVVLNRLPRAQVVQAEVVEKAAKEEDPNDWWHQRKKKQKTEGS